MRTLRSPEFSPVPEWVRQQRCPREPTSSSVELGSILPRIYPAYAKVFHPILIDPRIKNDHLTWDDMKDQLEGRRAQDISPVSGPVNELSREARLIRGSPDHSFEGGRIRWKELCAQLGLTFHPELTDSTFTRTFPENSWPRSLVGPDEGTLDLPSCQALVRLLRPVSGEESCFFFYSPFAVKGLTPLLFEGDLEEVPSTLEHDDLQGSPTYWWPTGKSWCVCSDPDLTFSFVGGPSELITALLSDPDLEVLPARLSDRVDRSADRLNR